MPIESFISNIISKCIFEDEMVNIFFYEFPKCVSYNSSQLVRLGLSVSTQVDECIRFDWKYRDMVYFIYLQNWIVVLCDDTTLKATSMVIGHDNGLLLPKWNWNLNRPFYDMCESVKFVFSLERRMS